MQLSGKKKTIFIGSVLFSKVALETMIQFGVTVDLVYSLDEVSSLNVSDYYPVHQIADEHGIPFKKFSKISEIADDICGFAPDFLFVIGLSQLIPQKLIDHVGDYAIGFHPTPLPKYRGRASLPWMILLGEEQLKVSIFKIDQGTDSGDIIIQEPYTILPTDYVSDVYGSVCGALANALNKCLNDIYNDAVHFVKQDDTQATYTLIRRPEDGKINWNLDGKQIHTLIRAASRPYPGAFAYYNDKKIIIQRADLIRNDNIIGIPGQIAKIENNFVYVIANGNYMLVFKDYTNDVVFRTGKKFI